jgi:hypothetical protein
MSHSTFSLYLASVEDWGRILTLANLWGFPNVKELAIRELEGIELSDIDRIVLYNRYAINPDALVPRYAALCAREMPLSVQEASKLGMETAMKVAHARECARTMLNGGIPAQLEYQDVVALVKNVFGLGESGTRFPVSKLDLQACRRTLTSTKIRALQNKG